MRKVRYNEEEEEEIRLKEGGVKGIEEENKKRMKEEN